MKKTFVWLLIVILIGGSVSATLYYIYRNRQTSGPEILRSTQVAIGDLIRTVAASGHINFEQSVDLSFSTSGVVRSIEVQPGERVEQGQIMAELDTTELFQVYEQAEIALAQAKLNMQIGQQEPDAQVVALARSSVNSAAQALESARLGKLASQSDASSIIVQAERDREAAYIKLREASDVQKPDAQNAFNIAVEQEAIARMNAELIIEQAKSQWWSAYYRYKQAEFSLEQLLAPPEQETLRQLQLQVDQAQLNVEQAEFSINDASLLAPFTGFVTQVNVQIGVRPALNQPAMKLVDKSTAYLEIAIDEIDIGKVVIGAPAKITLDAYPEIQLPGLVHAIAPSAQLLGGIVSYQVDIIIQDTQETVLREGLTATADITVDTISDVLLVPNWAVKTNQQTGETYTYLILNNNPIRTPLSLGQSGDIASIVISGLSEGDIVGLVSEEVNLLNPENRPNPSRQF
ncbi:MAG: efflux RND transporter periplasmic adaptor subunit [Anaerolineae bacterium]|nr:efflux RND transporter periplasmic adaptor subunit [Anaerolineae bacterium]